MSSPESAALLTARAFVNGNATGVDPSVTGREALIAWADAEMSSDDDWWLFLTLADFYWSRRSAPGVRLSEAPGFMTKEAAEQHAKSRVRDRNYWKSHLPPRGWGLQSDRDEA